MRGDFSSILLSYLKKFRELHIEKRRFACIVMVLALMVAGSVVWRLKYTGIAMTNETFCGMEEHIHTDECYDREVVCGMEEDEGHEHTGECYEEERILICEIEEGVPHEHTEECTELVLICEEEECEGHEHTDECYDEDGELICEEEECEGHEHTDDCYEVTYICGFEEGEIHEHTEECYETERVLICEEEERAGHVHQDECYIETLICEKEEHVHTIACLSDESADVEDKSDWVATLPDLAGIERCDVVAIAESQIGYTESLANFEVDDDDVARGYTRYGAWYGNKYGKWDAMFVSFCLYYAKVPESEFPQAAGAYAWRAELDTLGLYEDAGDYMPLAGDVIFFDSDGNERADRTGVVASVDCEAEILYIIEGDVETDDGDVVCENEYSLYDDTIVGYGALPYEEYIEEEEYTVEIEVVTEPVTEAEEAENEEIVEVVIEETPTEAVSEEATEEPTENAGEQATETALTAALTANLTAKAYSKTFEGEDYIVMVSYGDDAGIPDGAELVVSEYDKNSETYLARYAEAAELYGWEEATEAEESTEESTDINAGIMLLSEEEEETEEASAVEFRLFNIEFVAEGEVIEPSAEVKVTIVYLDREKAAECSVTHFREDAETEIIDVETEFEDGVQMIAFDTDGFSDYGISLTAVTSTVSELVAEIESVSELSGNSFAIISGTTTYAMLAELNTNNNGLKKTSTSSTALAELPQWTFEYVSGSGSTGTFRIYYEADDGTKYYLQMTYSSGSEGNLILTTSQSDASTFTVTVNSGGTVSIAATASGTTYYINQFSGDSGNADSVGFRGWYQNDTSLYLFRQSEELDEFRLWIYDENGTQVANYGDGSATGVVKYIDESNAVWCLIPVSYFESALASAGYTFNSSATDICPFQYAPSAYDPSADLTDAYYIEYEGNWYVAVQDTTGLDPYRSNVYYTGTTDGAVIEDNIINDGTFVAKVYVEGVELTDYDNYTYTWYKSEDDGETYTIVTDSDVLDGNTINVAKDQGGLCYYYFEVTLDDGITTLKSDPMQVPYATELLNGSFEQLDTDSKGDSGQYEEKYIPYWNTTASDNLIEIGKYAADKYTYGATGTATEGAGDQFAELNANTESALYQDVLTAPGEDLYWSLLHRARNATGGSTFITEEGTTTTTSDPVQVGDPTTTTNTTTSTVRENNKWVTVTTTTTETVTTYETTTVETTTYSATDTMYVVIMSASDAEKLLSGVSDSDQESVLTAMIESILQGSDYGEGTYDLVTGNYKDDTVTATVWEVTTTSTVKEITTTVTTTEVTETVTETKKNNNTTTSTNTSTSVISTTTTTTYEYSSWESYSGEYVVPDGQYLTRFFFVSGDTEYTGSNTVGNLLDEVYFSQEIQYTIEYWIWDNEKQEYYLVTSDTETGLVDPYTIVSAEKMAQYAENYALVDSVTGTQSGGSNPSSFDDPTTSTMKVQSGTTYLSLYFSNQGITIIKTLEGLSEEALGQIAAAGGAEFTFHVSGGTIDTDVTITVGDTGSGATYIYADSSSSGITYNITEIDFPKSLLDGAYTYTGTTSDKTSVTLTTENAAGTITFTNSYERKITLVKVSSVNSNVKLDAGFVLYKVESGNTYYYTDSGGWSADISDAVTLETGDDGTVEIEGLDDGDYYLREIKTPAGYNPLSYDIGFTLSGGEITLLDTDDAASVDGMEITVKNDPGEALPSTGGRGTHLPIILGALLVLAAFAIMFKNKRGEGEIV